MPCQTQTSQQPQQPTTVLPQTLPQTQADWSRFLQRMNEVLASISNAQYATGINAVPTEYAVYDGTGLPPLRVTGATTAFDTAHAQFGAGSLKLTATASTVTVELAASGYPITLHPNWQWIASLFLLTAAPSIAGKLSVVTPAKQYDVDISGSPGASWARLYGDYNLTADASTSCTLLLTLTGVTVGQVFNLEGWMLEPSQGAVLPSPFIMTSGPRTWQQVVNDGNKPQDGADVTASHTAADTAAVNGVAAATVNTNISTAQTTANAANTTANTAVTSAIVQNANFVNGTSYWTLTPAADFYQETGANCPNPNGNTYLVHKGVVAETYANAVSTTGAPVVPGQTVTAIMCLEEFSANSGAVANTAIFWYTASGGYIGESASTMTCGPTGTATRINSKVVAQAPATAAFCNVGVEYHNHTTGYINATTASLVLQPSNVDEIPDGNSYSRAISNAGSAIVIGNANFEAPLGLQGEIPGWKPDSGATLSYNTASPYSGSQSLQIVGSGTVNFGARSPVYQCAAGDSIFASAKGYAVSGNAAALSVIFLNGTTPISAPLVAYTTSYGSWQSLIGTPASAPATTTGFQIKLFNSNTSGTSLFDEIRVVRQAGLDNEVSDGTIYGRTSQSDLYSSGGVNRVGLRIAGSGQRVGDQRNLLQRTITNYPSKVSPGVSYSASAGTPAAAIISVAAFTALLGSVSVSYNAASASVTGTNGTNVNYYLYFNDPTYSGGTKTLVATTNQNDLYSGDGYVYVGYVTVAFPSSGSGSGGGTGCPLRTAWVIRRGRHGRPQHVRAGKVRVGDWLLRTDGEWAEVTFSRAELQPCVRLVADGFGTLGCSISAPMQLRDGSALSIACLAREVVARRAGERGRAVVTDLHDLGDQWVQHITLANAPDDFFWTGDVKNALFGHHNAKPP